MSPSRSKPLVSKLRVLIADDEQVIADTLAMILCAIGWEATAVYSGEAALEASLRLRPEVLISDVIMGRMNGIEAATLIRQNLPLCRVILCSGQAATSDLLKQAGADGHCFEVLPKPVHPQALIDRLKTLAQPTQA